MAAEIVHGGAAGSGGPTPLSRRSRPWHVFTGRLNARLDELAETDVWAMNHVEVAESIVELRRAQAKLAAIGASLLAHAERVDVAQLSSTTSTAAWLRGEVPLTPRQARQAVTLGRALDSGRYPATSAAMAAGVLQADQAYEVVVAVDALPDLLMAEDRLRGEAHLVELGRTHDARQLRRLGRYLLEVIDPDRAERELAAQLEAEEESAARATSFTLVDDGRGRAHGRFVLPSLQGMMLRKLLEGFANPAVPGAIPRTEPDAEPSGAARRRLAWEVMGDAFLRLVEAYPVEKVPTSGGLNASVVVTMPLETLTGGLARASVCGTEVAISPGAARRMACAAGVIPMVLNGKSQVLDQGRRRRFATPAQRLAKLVEQGGVCAIESCDRPASWADAHHWKKRWVDGGTSNLTDLVMICPRHHTLAHLPDRTMHPTPNGRYVIHRRT